MKRHQLLIFARCRRLELHEMELSDLALVNVDALAGCETGTGGLAGLIKLIHGAQQLITVVLHVIRNVFVEYF